MHMAPSDLSPSAPAYVPQASILRPSTVPMLPCYLPPPVEQLPPSCLPAGPFPGPAPPPPLFAGRFQPPPPPPVFACRILQGPPSPQMFAGPFQGPPPPPVFSVLNSFTGLPPAPMLTPRGQMALPAAPVPMQEPPLARLAEKPKDGGDKAPSASVRTWRLASGRRRPKPLLPPRKHVPVCGEAAGGHGGAKEEPANEPSPRSVLAEAGTSPPDSPPVVLPTEFPYQAPTPPPAPPTAVTRRAVAKEPRYRRVPASRSKPVQPRSPQQRAPPGHGARGRDRMPRLLFNPACSLTTLMIRNIPNSFSRKKLMNILDQHCAVENEKIASGGGGGGGGVSSKYDFLYVPIDFRTEANKGYAFVNVTSPEAASRLWVYLHGYKWKTKDSHKTCEVDYATIQGREALVDHFSGSYFECGTPEFLPVWFAPPRDGARTDDGQHVVGRLVRRSS